MGETCIYSKVLILCFSFGRIVAMQRYRTHPEDRLRNCNENSCDGTQERL
ncbi:hypothetical protein EXN66_Car006024 [Channa argus]|uniref:Uncharacterized protein n=1 Tax=Channa argus TaxID=215402 RepID=A0A6G1PJC6_CHAAH|nr:hypothetical protein EXN66_Car006024 [Channa argus]